MYKCDVCGREIFKKNQLHKHILCKKHFNQLKKYGKFLDHNPRSVNDLNDYIIHKDGTTSFNLYRQDGKKIAMFLIDTEDIEKVKYRKWRLSYGNIITGSKDKKKDISHVILGLSKDIKIDHIDGNVFNNTKKNLIVLRVSAMVKSQI